MASHHFLKVASVSAATIALLAGSTIPAAYAADESAPTTATAAAAADPTANAAIPLGKTVKTNDGLLVMFTMGLIGGPDGSISGASGVGNYDLSKLKLILNDPDYYKPDGYRLNANVHEAISVDDTKNMTALGGYASSDESVVQVSAMGNLTPVANGTATITFVPIIIKNNTVTYADTTVSTDVTVKDGVITVAEQVATPEPTETPTQEQTDTYFIPTEGTKITLENGYLFQNSAQPILREDGSNQGLTTISTDAFAGAGITILNLDTLKIGDTVNAQLDYTNAAGAEKIKAVYDADPSAALIGEWTSSNTDVVSVENGTLTVVGAGTTTITFTPVYVQDGVVVKSDQIFTYELTIPGEEVVSTPVVEPTSDPAAVVPAPAETPFVYENCAAVYAAGAAPIYEGQYGWDESLDADGDKKGCEDVPDYTNDDSQTADYYATNSQAELAETGAEVAVPLAAGLGLLVAGSGAVLFSRRRAQ